MNSPQLNEKLASDTGRVASLAASDMTNAEIIEEAYLLIFSRPPTTEERKKAAESLPQKERRLAVEDLFWALLNTPEFLFID